MHHGMLQAQKCNNNLHTAWTVNVYSLSTAPVKPVTDNTPASRAMSFILSEAWNKSDTSQRMHPNWEWATFIQKTRTTSQTENNCPTYLASRLSGFMLYPSEKRSRWHTHKIIQIICMVSSASISFIVSYHFLFVTNTALSDVCIMQTALVKIDTSVAISTR